MLWLLRSFGSSIGKKLVMALTGLAFCLFIFLHLIGNLTIFGGPNLFNAYSNHLHSYGPLLNLAEIGLLALAVLHICFGIWLFIENLRARPVRYAVQKNAGGRTLGSRLMPYTGIYLMLFVLVHLLTFHFVDRTAQTVFARVAAAFSSPGYAVFYVISVIVAALHVRHGFWSAFQTLGGNHPKYFPLIQGASLLFGFMVGIGFTSIPLFLFIGR